MDIKISDPIVFNMVVEQTLMAFGYSYQDVSRLTVTEAMLKYLVLSGLALLKPRVL